MQNLSDSICKELLALPEKDRIELALLLIKSLELQGAENSRSDISIQDEWIKEANQRYQQLITGSDKGMNNEQIWQDVDR